MYVNTGKRMNQIIIYKLCELKGTDNILSLDFKPISEKMKFKDINFRRVRGSIRLSNSRILLPNDIAKARKKVLNLSYR